MLATEPSAAGQLQRLYLPRSPNRREKYEYFGKQRRWVFAFLLIASVGVLYGYLRVAEHAWVVAPLMWLLLMVIVPPIVVNFWLRVGRPRLTFAEHQAEASVCHQQYTKLLLAANLRCKNIVSVL